MGKVKDWSRMLTEMFGGMFFEAKITYADEYEDAYEEAVSPLGYTGAYKNMQEAHATESALRGKDGIYPRKDGFYGEGQAVLPPAGLPAAPFYTPALPKGDSFFEEALTFEKKEKERADGALSFENREQAYIADSPLGKSYIDAAQAFEKAFAAYEGEAERGLLERGMKSALPREDFDISHTAVYRMLHLKFSEMSGDGAEESPQAAEEALYPMGAYAFKRSKREAERILSSTKSANVGQQPVVNIEMVNNNNIQNELDVDRALEELSERLCEAMARGADGLYL